MSTVTLAAWPTAGSAAVVRPRLLTAGNYAVIGASAITNTGPTAINGNVAISPSNASSVTGFPPGVITGGTNYADGAAIQAHNDLVTTYNDIAGATPFVNMSGVNLGGKVLTPGVYRFSSSAQLTGTLTLDAKGSTNAIFIFQIGSTLTTASGSRVVLRNGAGGCAVFWKVTSSATLGTATSFQGNLVALTSISLTTGATIGVGGGSNGGRALARNGAVTLDTNVITPPPGNCASSPSRASTSLTRGSIPVPNAGAGVSWPLALSLSGSGLLALAAATARRRRTRILG